MAYAPCSASPSIYTANLLVCNLFFMYLSYQTYPVNSLCFFLTIIKIFLRFPTFFQFNFSDADLAAVIKRTCKHIRLASCPQKKRYPHLRISQSLQNSRYPSTRHAAEMITQQTVSDSSRPIRIPKPIQNSIKPITRFIPDYSSCFSS